MDVKQKVLFVDARTGFYRVAKYPVGDFFGPVDLGLHLAGRFNSLNIGVGLLAGSILPGSNRLVVHRLLAVLGRLLRLVDGRRRPGLRQPRHQHAVDRRQGGDAVRAGAQPPARRGSRRRAGCRSTCRASGRPGRLGVYALLDDVHAQLHAALLARRRGSSRSARPPSPRTSAASSRCRSTATAR